MQAVWEKTLGFVPRGFPVDLKCHDCGTTFRIESFGRGTDGIDRLEVCCPVCTFNPKVRTATGEECPPQSEPDQAMGTGGNEPVDLVQEEAVKLGY